MASNWVGLGMKTEDSPKEDLPPALDPRLMMGDPMSKGERPSMR